MPFEAKRQKYSGRQLRCICLVLGWSVHGMLALWSYLPTFGGAQDVMWSSPLINQVKGPQKLLGTSGEGTWASKGLLTSTSQDGNCQRDKCVNDFVECLWSVMYVASNLYLSLSVCKTRVWRFLLIIHVLYYAWWK